MTLPYPDSPDIDENIATSIERIKDNFDYLDGQIGTNAIKMVASSSVELSTRSGVVNVQEEQVNFTPKAVVIYATEEVGNSQSWGCACKTSTTLSASCACTWFDGGGGGVSDLNCVQLYQTSTSYVVGSISIFLSSGARFNWTKTADPGGKALNLLYIFFG